MQRRANNIKEGVFSFFFFFGSKPRFGGVYYEFQAEGSACEKRKQKPLFETWRLLVRLGKQKQLAPRVFGGIGISFRKVGNADSQQANFKIFLVSGLH